MAGQPNLLYPSPSEAAVPGNTLATVSGGGMTAAAEQRLQFDAMNMAIMPKTAQLSLRAQDASQMFTGTLNTEGRKSALSGVFLRRLSRGFGQQQRPQDSAASSPMLSGEVVLEPY